LKCYVSFDLEFRAIILVNGRSDEICIAADEGILPSLSILHLL